MRWGGRMREGGDVGGEGGEAVERGGVRMKEEG